MITTSEEHQGPAMKRVLTLRDLWIYGIAFMLPIAPAYIYGFASDKSGGMLASAYLLALAAMIFTAMSYGHMSSAFPSAGSTFSYAEKGINPYAGFFAGWLMMLDYVLCPLIVFMAGATYGNALIPEIPYWVWVLVIGVTVTAINVRGVDLAAKTNLILVGFMFLVVLFFIFMCIRALLSGTGEATLWSMTPIYNPAKFDWNALVSGAAITCLSYMGFDSISTMAEESVNPRRDIGRATVLACLTCGLIYFLQSYLSQLVWPDYTAFKDPDAALFEIAGAAGGSITAALYTTAVVVASFTCGIASQSSAARLLFSMGRDHFIPSPFFAHIHPVYDTPSFNVILMGVIGMAGAIVLNIPLVAELINFGGLFGFICVNIAVIRYYYIKQKQHRFFRYLLFPFVGAAVCFYLWIHLSPLCLTVGILWTAAGLLHLVVSTRGFKEKPPVLQAYHIRS